MNSLSVSSQRKHSSVASGSGYFQFGCPLVLCILFTIPMVSLGQLKEEKKRIGSKIVDDTTKNVYGPKTTLWTTEKNLFYNKKTYYAVDTSINDYHRWTHVQRVNNFYTDLGNVGTAMNPIFYTFSSSIGVTAGFNVYNPFYESVEPKYFDTKSPYTRMFIIWGG